MLNTHYEFADLPASVLLKHITRKSLNHHHFPYISFILFWVDAEKNKTPQCNSYMLRKTLILWPPSYPPHFLTSQGARLVATVQGWRSPEPLAAPRDAVRSAQVAAPLAAAVAERTSVVAPVICLNQGGGLEFNGAFLMPSQMDGYKRYNMFSPTIWSDKNRSKNTT